jgi:hypothetical protein
MKDNFSENAQITLDTDLPIREHCMIVYWNKLLIHKRLGM